LVKQNLSTDKEASKKNRPKAGKKRVLDLYTAALERKQDKESKAKVAKRRVIKAEESLSSQDSISVNNLDHKFRVANAVSKVKSTKKADKKKDNEEMDIGFCQL
jgi:hypothetical protein